MKQIIASDNSTKGLPLYRIVIELITAIFIFLWIYTGVNKYMHFDKFSIELTRSPFIEGWAPVLSYVLPAGELLLAGMLLLRRTRLAGLYLSFLVMALFTGYVYIMLTYAPDLPCTCGGIIEELSWVQHLYLNAVLTVLALTGVLLTAGRKGS